MILKFSKIFAKIRTKVEQRKENNIIFAGRNNHLNNQFMKTYTIVLSLIALFLTPSVLKAQDVIMKNDSTTIESKVVKIDKNVIEYKKWSNLDGPTYTISVLDVLCITYQNGEVESYKQKIDNLRSELMYRVGHELVINHRALSKEEAKKILTTEQYDTYVSAKAQMQVGSFFAVVFAGSLFCDIVCIAQMIGSNDKLNLDTWADCLMISAVITDISCPLWIVLRGIGKGRLNWVASDYNYNNSNGSLSLAPTLIKCEMPQLQNNYSLGMTLKVSF